MVTEMKMVNFFCWALVEFIALIGVYRLEKFRWPIPVISINTLITGALSLFVFQQGYSVLSALSVLIVVAGLSSAMIVDIMDKRIPNYIIFTMAILQTLITVAKLILYTEKWIEILASSIINPVIMFIVLLILSRISKDGIGMGDVKLLTVLSFICGVYVVINVLVFALFICVVVAMILVLAKKKNSRDKIAFGPFVYIGFIVTLLLGA